MRSFATVVLVLLAVCAGGASAQSVSATCSSNFNAQTCFASTGGCKWCTSSATTKTSSMSGSCISSTSMCSSTSTFSTTMVNPCASLTSQSSCAANDVCGWCSSPARCMFSGIGLDAGSIPSACSSGFFSPPSCSSNTDRTSCYNFPSRCYWCPSSSTCVSSILSCGTTNSNDCTTSFSSSCSSTSRTFMYSYNTGACGWCPNYYGTGIGSCLYYTVTSPSECYTASSFIYNTGVSYSGVSGAAVGAAVGMAVSLLIIIILLPVICVVCVIGCSVYWCCIRPKNQTTVVVAGGYQQQPMMMQGQQPMMQGQPVYGQPVAMGQPMGMGQPPPSMGYAPHCEPAGGSAYIQPQQQMAL